MSRYNIHETTRKCFRIGSPPSAGDCLPAKGARNPRSRTPSGGIAKLGSSLESDVQTSGKGGITGEASSRPGIEIRETVASAIGKNALKRPLGVQLSDRTLDLEAGRRGDLEKVRGAVSYWTCLVHSPGIKVELSKARISGTGTEREGHKQLESAAVAAYKKSPNEKAGALSLLMVGALCCSHSFGVLGHPLGRHRFCGCGSDTTVFLRFPDLRFLPVSDALVFISVFSVITSIGRKRYFLSDASNVGSDVKSSSFWTGATSIVPPCGGFVKNTLAVSMWHGFRRMLHSSTRLNKFGTIPSMATLLIIFLTGLVSWKQQFELLLKRNVAISHCFVRSSRRLNLYYDMFLY